MYVMIDLDNMRFLMRHPDQQVLCYYMIIQWPERAIDIQPCDHPAFLSDYTEFELGTLYENSTGIKRSVYGIQMRAVLAELVYRIPLPDCTKFELERQSSQLENSIIPHKYVKGSFQAARLQGLFPDTIYKIPRHPNEPAVAAKGKSIYSVLYPITAK